MICKFSKLLVKLLLLFITETNLFFTLIGKLNIPPFFISIKVVSLLSNFVIKDKFCVLQNKCNCLKICASVSWQPNYLLSDVTVKLVSKKLLNVVWFSQLIFKTC